MVPGTAGGAGAAGLGTGAAGAGGFSSGAGLETEGAAGAGEGAEGTASVVLSLDMSAVTASVVSDVVAGVGAGP